MIKTCVKDGCNNTFEIKNFRSRQRYCKLGCRPDRALMRLPRKCARDKCDVIFTRERGSRRKYCTRECLVIAFNGITSDIRREEIRDETKALEGRHLKKIDIKAVAKNLIVRKLLMERELAE